MGIFKKSEFWATEIRMTYRNKFGGIEIVYFDNIYDLIDFVKTIDDLNKKR